MRLNSDLIARELARTHEIRVRGPAEKDLALHRPELLEPSNKVLEPNHLYIGRVDQLPQRVEIGHNVTLVVTGSSARLRWFCERCCVIEVVESGELSLIFNEVQRLYQRYAHWEEALWSVLDDDASVQALLNASSTVLDGSLLVLDADFNVLASTAPTDGAGPSPRPFAVEGGNFNPTSLDEFLSQHELAMDVATPFIMDVSGMSTLSVNLLRNGAYFGCVTQLASPGGSCEMADAPVMALLAQAVLRALQRLDITSEKSRGSLRRSLAALVDGEPLDALSLLSLSAREGSYVCLKMCLNNRGSRLPLSYVRNLVEDNLSDTVAFVYQRSYVVAFSRLDDLAPEGERRTALEQLLEPMTGSIGMRIGISDHLRGLQSARTHYLQAGIALDNGMALAPEQTIYRFQDFALPELIMNSLGDLSVEAYYTPGLRRLFEHDERGSVSYIDTLERYLDLNMNVTAAARSLYLHRSTLIERLSHIKEAMGNELDEPSSRLRVQIVLAARRLNLTQRVTGTS